MVVVGSPWERSKRQGLEKARLLQDLNRFCRFLILWLNEISSTGSAKKELMVYDPGRKHQKVTSRLAKLGLGKHAGNKWLMLPPTDPNRYPTDCPEDGPPKSIDVPTGSNVGGLLVRLLRSSVPARASLPGI